MNQDEERKPPPSLGSTPSQPQRPQLQRQILNNKQQILGNLNRKFTGEETSRWLQAMEESPHSAAETIVPGRLVEETQISTPMVLDILFDNIQRYSYELNQSPPEPGLIIQAQRPQGFQERTSFSGNQKIKFMRGHITMREWSMVVYAEETRISVHVLPTDFLMGFSPEQKDFPPYLIIGQERARGGHIWKIESEVIGIDVLPQLSRRLLSHLVKVARQEADPQDRFTFRSRQESGEEGVDRSFEQIPESDPGLHPGAQLSSSQPQKDSNMAQTRSQVLKNKMAEAAQQEAARSASRPSIAPAAVAPPPPSPSSAQAPPLASEPPNGSSGIKEGLKRLLADGHRAETPEPPASPGSHGLGAMLGNAGAPAAPGPGSAPPPAQQMPPPPTGLPPAGMPGSAPGSMPTPPGGFASLMPHPFSGSAGSEPGMPDMPQAPPPGFSQPGAGGPPPGFQHMGSGAPPGFQQMSSSAPGLAPSPTGPSPAAPPGGGFGPIAGPGAGPASAPQSPAPQAPAPQAPAPQAPAPQTPAPQAPAPQTSAPGSDAVGADISGETPVAEPAAPAVGGSLADLASLLGGGSQSSPSPEGDFPDESGAFNRWRPSQPVAPTEPSDASAPPTPIITPAREISPPAPSSQAMLPDASGQYDSLAMMAKKAAEEPPVSHQEKPRNTLQALLRPEAPAQPPVIAPEEAAPSAASPEPASGRVAQDLFDSPEDSVSDSFSSQITSQSGLPASSPPMAASEQPPAPAQSMPEPLAEPAPAPAPAPAAPALGPSSGGSSLIGLDKVVENAENEVVSGCERLLSGVDQALNALKQAGMEAMQDDNLEAVAMVMNYTKRLKTLREKLSGLSTELGQIE